jgi:uncharacterized membrane protein
MQYNCFSIINTIFSFAILIAIIIFIYKGIRGFKNFIKVHKEMDKKIDVILNKLEGQKDNDNLK